MPSSSGATPLEAEGSTKSAGNDSEGRSVQTQSVTSSVLREFRYEDGRRYHAYLSHLYLFPNDDGEQDRLNLQHHIFRLSMDNTLHSAPIPQDRQLYILDAGCGTGIWTIEMAEKYPLAKVLGVDLSPIQPDTAPENCVFRVDNLESEWIPGEEFDFIHLRAMILGISDWARLFEQSFEHLKPGGYIELQDFSLPVESLGQQPPQGAFMESSHHMMEAMARHGKDFTIPTRWKDMLRDAGFIDVHQKWYNWPIGPWAKGKKNKLLGRLLLADLHDGLTASTAIYANLLGWTLDEAHAFVKRAQEDMMAQKTHFYMKSTVIYAKKPETADA